MVYTEDKLPMFSFSCEKLQKNCCGEHTRVVRGILLNERVSLLPHVDVEVPVVPDVQPVFLQESHVVFVESQDLFVDVHRQGAQLRPVHLLNVGLGFLVDLGGLRGGQGGDFVATTSPYPRRAVGEGGTTDVPPVGLV